MPITCLSAKTSIPYGISYVMVTNISRFIVTGPIQTKLNPFLQMKQEGKILILNP